MKPNTLNNLSKILDEIKEDLPNIEIKMDETDFSILKNNTLLANGYIRDDKNKIEIFNENTKRINSEHTYKKLKELIENNINFNINKMRIKDRKNNLQNILLSIDYIKENYNLYSYNESGFILSPKKCCSKFSIIVKNYVEVSTHLKFNEDFKIEEVDKVKEIVEEFKKVSNLILKK